MPSTLLLGLGQAGVTARLWNYSLGQNEPPDSFDASIGYPGCWDVRATSEDEQAIGFQCVPVGSVRVWFRKPGYVDQYFDTFMPDNGAKEVRLQPAPKPLLPLHVEGEFIYTSDGQRYIQNHVTNYLLAQRFMLGQDISGLLYDGFDGDNVTFCMSVVPKQAGLPEFRPETDAQFYYKVNDFFTYMRSKGRRGEATLLCDCDVMGLDFAWQERHTNLMYDILRGFPEWFVQLGNEVKKNGVEWQRLSQPSGLFWSRGSSLAGQECPLPPGNYSGAHLARGGGGEYLDAQPYYMVHGYAGYEGTHGPVVTNETKGTSDTEDSDRRSTNPDYFRKVASAMRKWAGGTLHLEKGIHSEPLMPGTKQDACRLGWLEGIR